MDQLAYYVHVYIDDKYDKYDKDTGKYNKIDNHNNRYDNKDPEKLYNNPNN